MQCVTKTQHLFKLNSKMPCINFEIEIVRKIISTYNLNSSWSLGFPDSVGAAADFWGLSAERAGSCPVGMWCWKCLVQLKRKSFALRNQISAQLLSTKTALFFLSLYQNSECPLHHWTVPAADAPICSMWDSNTSGSLELYELSSG